MSHVSGVVLCLSLLDEDNEQVAAIQSWLQDSGKGRLVQLDGRAGGNKHPQIVLYSGGFNYLDEDDLALRVMAGKWVEPDHVLLVIYPEDGPPREWRCA